MPSPDHLPFFLAFSYLSLPMVVGTATDANGFYVPFQYPYVDDAPQSSEDGSGLHSPTFIDSDASMDARRHGCTYLFSYR